MLVISRSGASSVAELLVLGRPALLVPYRLAADDHQRANAEAVAAAGAGLADRGERARRPPGSPTSSRAWLDQPEQLAEMAARARELGRPDAARTLADALEGLALAPSPHLQREALA